MAVGVQHGNTVLVLDDIVLTALLVLGIYRLLVFKGTVAGTGVQTVVTPQRPVPL